MRFPGIMHNNPTWVFFDSFSGSIVCPQRQYPLWSQHVHVHVRWGRPEGWLSYQQFVRWVGYEESIGIHAVAILQGDSSRLHAKESIGCRPLLPSPTDGTPSLSLQGPSHVFHGLSSGISAALFYNQAVASHPRSK
jgi:hypothetical protein